MPIVHLLLMFTFAVSLFTPRTTGERAFVRSENTYSAAKKVNPKKKDRDHDFVSDWDELNVFRTNPRRKDSNRNGIIDGFEYSRKKHKLMKDQREKFDKDPDNDGLTNEEEAFWGTDPKDSDSDDDGVVDGNEDSDGNGIANEDEDDPGNAGATREDLDDSGGVLPTATPLQQAPPVPTSGGAHPTPTRTPLPAATPGGCFNADLETHCFGIPNGVTGKVSRGAGVWAATCAFTGCHASDGRPPKSYQEISTALVTVSAMLGLQVSTQQRADVTAYRNRP